MSVFSGVIPTITIFKNSNLNSVAKGALNNLASTGLSFGLNKVLGDTLSARLGIKPTGNSNFLNSLVGPGLIDTGVQGLNQIVTTSITNSKALGPLGPLAGNLINAGIGSLGNQLTNSLFGARNGTASIGSNGTVYFPGAGGPGEEEANFSKGSSGLLGSALGQKATSQPYSIGSGGPDVVFSIIAAADAAIEEARRTTEAAAAGQASPGSAPNVPAKSADVAEPGAISPAPNSSNNSNQPSNPAPTSPTQAPATAPAAAAAPAALVPPAVPAGARTINAGSSSGTITIVSYPNGEGAQVIGQTGVPSEPLSEPAAIATTASASTATQPTGAQTGQPATANPIVADQVNNLKPQRALSRAETLPGWKFICPPEDISWETSFQADRIPIFGLNDAPVIGGSKGMRELTLNNAIVEGFTRGKTVEDKIALLEQMMRMKLGKGSGANNSEYVQIPVYKVYANDKAYGFGKSPNEQGFFIIKSVKVQEKLRDLSGRTTRALVDISLTQVPSYQVDSGRDIASAFLPSQRSPIDAIGRNVLEKATPQLIRAAGDAAAKARNAGRGVNGQPDAGTSTSGAGGAGTPPRAVDPRSARQINNVPTRN